MCLAAILNPNFSPFVSVFFLCRETNLKFKMGLRVTDERLQEERQLAGFDGECASQLQANLIRNGPKSPENIPKVLF